MSPLQDLADDAINPVTNFFDSLGRANELQAENEQLRARARRGAQGADRGGQGGDSPSSTELKQLARPPDIADYDGVYRRGRRRATGNFARTFADSTRAATSGIAMDMPVVVGDERWPRSSARSSSVSKSRSTVQRIDDPQLRRRRAARSTRRTLGPKGIARRPGGQQLARSRRSTRSTRRVDEGRGRDHARRLDELAVPAGPRGRHGRAQRRRRRRDRRQRRSCGPVVDLDRSTSSRCCATHRCRSRDPSHPPRARGHHRASCCRPRCSRICASTASRPTSGWSRCSRSRTRTAPTPARGSAS